MITDFLDGTYNFISQHSVTIVVVIACAYAAQLLVMMFLARVIRRTIRPARFKTKKEEKQREDTIISILRTVIKIIIWTLAALVLLGEFGINIGPLIAGAGIAGVALGFGAQSLVKDYLAGIFIVSENQYRVGDVLQVNQDVAGVVEHVSLRATVLRDLAGVVHYVPNGTIEIATNMTMDYAQVDLNVSVGYESDIDHVEKVINEVGKEIFADEKWKDIALEAPYMLRVNEFAESAIIVKVVCQTAPIRQWEVKSEILRRLKKAFEREGIVIPYPQRVLHNADIPARAAKK